MKKVALSLLALAVLGTGAFAQEAPALKIGGYLDTGIKAYSKSDSGSSYQVVGDDTGKNGGSYEFKLSYGTDKAGVNLRVRAEDLAGATYSFYPRTAYAWFLVPSLEAVKVVAGNTADDGLVGNGLDDKGEKLTAGNGLGVAVTPAEGFVVGGALLGPSKTNSAPAIYAFGASFTVPATATVNAAAVTSADKDNKTALGGVNVTAKLLLDGPLSANAGVNFYQLNKPFNKDYTYNVYDVLVGYKVTDAFSAQLLTYVYTFGSDLKQGGDSATLSYKLNPSVSYVVDPITTVGLGATYGTGAYINAKLDGSDIALTQKISMFEVKPNVTFTIDPATKVLVFYAYDSYSGDDAKTDKTVSTISVEARYSF